MARRLRPCACGCGQATFAESGYYRGHRPPPSLEVLSERFWARVEKTDGCWLWTGMINYKGYGDFNVGRPCVRAHRFAYELLVGPIPEGMYVLHRCDVRNCVRPDHLFVGTHDDNMADMVAKGRGRAPVGMANRAARLSWEQVVEIRRRFASGEPAKVIAGEFGIVSQYVYQLAHLQARRVA